MTLRRRPAVQLIVLLALMGCGGASGEEGREDSEVRFVLADLQAASRDGDGKRICEEIFTPKLADSVASASKAGSCAKEVRQNLFTPEQRLVVEGVEVADPRNATATVTEANGNTSKVSLVRPEQGGGWRIRGVEPQPG